MIYAFHGISYGIPPICLTFSQRVIIISKLQIRIKILKSCSINISDCLKSPGTCDSSPCNTTCKIKTDKNNTCKTCVMLITSPEFTSNLTGKTYYTKSFEPLDCSTKNVIYGIECTLCGLLYVGETRQSLRSRMSQHRYDAKDPKYRILYNHFNQPGHDRCLTMKVRIIEKIYHHTNSPILSTPYRTDRELFWIKELGTAMPYGCNDNIKGVEICQVLDATKST